MSTHTRSCAGCRAASRLETYAVVDKWVKDLEALQALPRTGASTDPVVWHYTTRNGLKEVLRTHNIRASDASTMNDPLELHTGHQTIADAPDRAALATDTAIAVQRHLEICRNLMDAEVTFVLSASTDGDRRPQRARYPGYDGYAIGFRTHLGELTLLEDRTGDGALNKTRRQVEVPASRNRRRFLNVGCVIAPRFSASSKAHAELLGTAGENDFLSHISCDTPSREDSVEVNAILCHQPLRHPK